MNVDDLVTGDVNASYHSESPAFALSGETLRDSQETVVIADDDEEIHYIDLSQDYLLPSGELTNLGSLECNEFHHNQQAAYACGICNRNTDHSLEQKSITFL